MADLKSKMTVQAKHNHYSLGEKLEEFAEAKKRVDAMKRDLTQEIIKEYPEFVSVNWAAAFRVMGVNRK